MAAASLYLPRNQARKDEMTNVALTGLARDLARRADEGRPVRVGVIGCGEMGTDLVTQIAQMKGIVIGAIADRSGFKAREAMEIAGRDPDSAAEAETPAAILAAIEAGKTAIVSDADRVISCDLVDVVVDATGKPAAGAEIGMAAMEHGKHLVMMNVEADVTIGAYLRQAAERLGVVYSVGAGD